MAKIDIDVAGRKYAVACRDGEEAHLRDVAAIVDRRARDAGAALGSLSEARTLLFAALLLADDLNDAARPSAALTPAPDPELAGKLETLADRFEAMADLVAGFEGDDAPLEHLATTP